MGATASGRTAQLARGDDLGACWPPWARIVASLALLFHATAILAGALAANPSSPLERSIARVFAPYHQLIDQGYAYRYYAPEPGPTPIATAVIRFADARPEVTVRLPQRGVTPKLRYQRQLALANHLASDFEAARSATGDGRRSRWAQSYARHLAKDYPGCATVSLFLESHLIPDPDRFRQALSVRSGPPIDLDAEEFYTTRERIGEFPCDAL